MSLFPLLFEIAWKSLLVAGTSVYRAPSWLKEKGGDGNLRWRVVALDQQGTAEQVLALESKARIDPRHTRMKACESGP